MAQETQTLEKKEKHRARARNNGCSVAGNDDQPSKLNIYFHENMTKV
jgi:hypothetical protein